MLRRIVAVLALATAAAPALAHGQDHALEAQLVAEGEALLVGDFDAPQPGPLVVAPYREGALPCGDAAAAGYGVDVGGGARAAFLGNATHVAAVLDLPRAGYAAFAVDTHGAARTLLLMQEQAVALHRLAAVLPNGSVLDARGGVLGIPYALPGADAHGFGLHGSEETGLRIAYDDVSVEACSAGDPAHLTLAFARAALPASLAPGSAVHVVALFDPEVPAWLPRPLPSTQVLQATLYLARPGEDAAALRAALDPQPGLAEAVPLLSLALGALLVSRQDEAAPRSGRMSI